MTKTDNIFLQIQCYVGELLTKHKQHSVTHYRVLENSLKLFSTSANSN